MKLEKLVEMPLNIKSVGSFYSTISNLVNKMEESGETPTKVGYNIYKFTDSSFMLYYYKDHGSLISGVLLSKVKKGVYKVSAAGKHDAYRSRKPYISEVYNAIINDLGTNEALLSDTHLTEDGIQVWKRLIKQFPNKVSIYDRVTKEITPITNGNEVQRVFSVDPNMSKYQFMIRGQRNVADTSRIVELAGIKKTKKETL